MPEYEGGYQALLTFMRRNLKRPGRSSATIPVQFTIDLDGSIKNAKILKRHSAPYDAEALRVFNLMPKWRPARHHGKLVRVTMVLPVKFK